MNFHLLNILILEDDSFQCEILVNIFRILEVASIQEAENGNKALEIIRGIHLQPSELCFVI